MSSTNSCPECGEPLPKDAPRGFCPKCLMQKGLTPTFSGSREDEESFLPLEETSDRYAYFDEIGRGGMAKVFLVHDERLDRDIALKEMMPAGTPKGEATPTPVKHSKEMAARFFREAKITGQLEHPSITPVHEIGRREDGTPYYTMKLVHGKTLGAAIREADNLEERLKLLPHFVDLCQAIAYAHSCKVIHRDIKPPNVMVGNFGETVVIDWGLAKVKGKDNADADNVARTILSIKPDLDDDSVETAYGTVMGTLAYAPPEQAEGEIDKIDERSDVYALGAVFYEILTGKPPHTGGTRADLARKVVMEQPKAIQSIESGVPDELVAICTKAIQKEPDRRYQTAGELANEVQRFLSGALVGAYQYNFGHHLRRFIGRYTAPLATAAAALIAVLVTGAVSYLNVLNARDQEQEMRIEAQQARAAAEEAQGVAEESAERERSARSEAEQAREFERIARETAEYDKFLLNINLAQERLNEDNVRMARQQLLEVPEGLRGWEWGYLVNKAWGDLREAAFAKLSEPKPDQTTADLWRGARAQLVAVLSKHSAGVTELHFNSDGSVLISSASDKLTHLYNVDSGNIILSFEGSNGILSEDERWVATLSEENIVIWNAETGELFRRLAPPEEERLSSFSFFSPDNSKLTATTWGQTKRLLTWDIQTGALVATSEPLTDRVNGLGDTITGFKHSEDGRQVTITAGANSLVTYDTASLEQISMVQGPRADEGYWAYAISPDGKTVISPKQEFRGEAVFWDATTGDELWFADRDYRPEGVTDLTRTPTLLSFSADSSVFAQARSDGTVILHDPREQKLISFLSGFAKSGFRAEFSSDGATLAVADREGIIRLLRPAEEVRPRDILEGHTSLVLHTRYSPDGTIVATGSTDRTVILWDAATRSPLRKLEHTASLWRLSFSPDSQFLLTEDQGGVARLWDVDTGEEKWRMDGGPNWGGTMGTFTIIADFTHDDHQRRFSPDGSSCLITDSDQTVRIVRVASGETVFRLEDHDGFVVQAEYSSDGARIVTAGGNSPRLWSATTGEEIQWTATGRSSFSFDGLRIVAASGRTAKVYDASTGDEILTLNGEHGGDVEAVPRFSPGGQHIVTGSADHTAILWDAHTGDRIADLQGHTTRPGVLLGVSHAIFSPDGQRILTQAWDSTVRVWDLQGNELATLECERNSFYTSWSPNGSSILTDSGPEQSVATLYDSIPWAELSQLGGEDASLDERISLWYEQQRTR